jgi:hypothetical protein
VRASDSRDGAGERLGSASPNTRLRRRIPTFASFGIPSFFVIPSLRSRRASARPPALLSRLRPPLSDRKGESWRAASSPSCS